MRKTSPEDLIPGALEKYTHDLTALALQGRFMPLQRRDKEIERVFQVLARPRKNHPMLIGEDSAQRFAIVAEVARRSSAADIPETVRVRRVVALDLEALIADTQTRGDFEKLLRSVFAEVKQSEGQILLFIDDFHRLVGGNWAEKTIDTANVLAPALARGEVNIIGTTNLDDFRKYIERHQSLQRRFQEIIVRELID